MAVRWMYTCTVQIRCVEEKSGEKGEKQHFQMKENGSALMRPTCPSILRAWFTSIKLMPETTSQLCRACHLQILSAYISLSHCSTYQSSPHTFDTTSVRLPINQTFLLFHVCQSAFVWLPFHFIFVFCAGQISAFFQLAPTLSVWGTEFSSRGVETCLYSARGNFEWRLPEEGTCDAVRTNEIKEISPAGTARYWRADRAAGSIGGRSGQTRVIRAANVQQQAPAGLSLRVASPGSWTHFH